MTDRKIVIPGEVIFSGEDYLPGKGTEKKGNEIVANVFGLAEEENNLVKVIPLAGKYEPRRGNVIIGRVEMLTHNGWVIDFGNSENAFLPLSETPRFVSKNALEEVMKIFTTAMSPTFITSSQAFLLTNLGVSLNGKNAFSEFPKSSTQPLCVSISTLPIITFPLLGSYFPASGITFIRLFSSSANPNTIATISFPFFSVPFPGR